jgi:N-methylhydantoinase A/oxoprolinase/acetone carboxylase beta subunit
MPDLFSPGLGGGSRVRQEDGNVEIGPDSVGSAIREEALVFGGRTLTATDLAVAAGLAKVGDPSRVESLDQEVVRSGLTRIQAMITDALDRMKSTAAPVPLVLVGGGSILVQEPVQGMSTVIRPPHYEVANAVGAAIAQVSGELDTVYAADRLSRESMLKSARAEAIRRAIANGAVEDTARIVDIEDIPLAYMERSMVRVRARAVGDLRHDVEARLGPSAAEIP